jgi:hypothetical protein
MDAARLSEYTLLLAAADPAQAARILEVGKALGRTPDEVKADAVEIQTAVHALARMAAAPDLRKMSGHQLLSLGVRQQQDAQRGAQEAAQRSTAQRVKASQDAAAAASAAAPDYSRLSGPQLLGLGISERGNAHLPQEFAR